ncbi:LGFP repeat-containing protein [Mycobacterium malmoense]|uniref:Transmembrane alanine and glycine rich protein n=1 Tax=Mycobacterium malmoense TaxID=1780 RepID=A0ABX3SVK5_MYCMA|nr:LGFP repeat-containing protein [Mycobacterium malmoense]ORA84253.1 hypothetical protein BST29_07105 [Mycobacterium malmoense]QZA19211.1 LGFP repeat-containing protein [Mycobacterium malmoense]UNB95969.1 LGFP repeat-containing protein [Mycobacterium malmoense]
MRRLVGTALISIATTVATAALLASTASASPIGDAEAAIMAAWEKAGGDGSPLGARKGDVYAIGDGFALDFDGGKMFYTPDTGAKFLYGPVLDKYESLGGPAGSDLGFPTINEVPGLAGPDSRVATFSASDKPVIFWTSDHGAFVVRGALNAAWDKLGSSGGVLGAPIEDETYDGEATAQKFSGGEISWNRKTKEFTTNPAALADQLKGLQVTVDPTAAINMAWRAAGGAAGPLGAKLGGPYPIGGDGIAQNFAGGKVYFSPATGANAVESDILAKYESLGGPVGSDLGFPTANESDGGIGHASRIATFSAADKPVIFWTADHGAFVVRGAMKAAWDKLRGPTGKLGAPVDDQAVDGDVVSQQFTGGKISWNRAKNTFTTDPANLAPLLSGLQVSGQNQPSTAAMPSHAKPFTWHWWWLLAAIPVLVLVVLLVVVAAGWRRRRSARDTPAYEPERGADAGYEAAADGHWGRDDADLATEHLPLGDLHPPELQPPPDAGPAARVSWSRGAAADLAEDVATAGAYGGEARPVSEEENPDAVDTDSIPVVSEAELSEVGYPEASEEADYLEADYVEADYVEADYVEADYVEADAGYADDGYPDAAPDDTVVPVAVAPDTQPRTGRHAAIDAEDDAEDALEVIPEAANAAPGPAGRPTIHLPLEDPYQVPDGYPIKASARFGLYYTPGSELYHDTLAEIWLSSEEVAQANGFIKAD